MIVTCNPDAEFFSRIEKVRSQVARIALIDNGSSNACVSSLRELANSLGVYLVLNHSNLGVARALNQGGEWAAEHGFRWMLTLDQDSIIAPDMVDSLVDVYQAYPESNNLAVIGSNYTNSVSGKPGAEYQEREGPYAKDVKTVITSGSLVSMSAFQAIGGFREEFFVDCVDLEYCLRARAKGFRVVMSCKPLMQHSIGSLTEHCLPWEKTGTSNHSPWRQYFMTRNTLILAREYLSREPGWVLSTAWSRTKSMLLICLFEEERLQKVAYSLRGALDGLRGKMSRSA